MSDAAARNTVRLALFASLGVVDPKEQDAVMGIIQTTEVPKTPEGVIAQIQDAHRRVKAARDQEGDL